MKNIQFLNAALILAIAFFLGFNFYQDQQQASQIDRKVEEYNANTCATLDGMESEIDSIHAQIGKLATATVYIDSCQQQKTQKAERAERRGRFVGGLLKGLLPF